MLGSSAGSIDGKLGADVCDASRLLVFWRDRAILKNAGDVCPISPFRDPMTGDAMEDKIAVLPSGGQSSLRCRDPQLLQTSAWPLTNVAGSHTTPPCSERGGAMIQGHLKVDAGMYQRGAAVAILRCSPFVIAYSRPPDLMRVSLCRWSGLDGVDRASEMVHSC